MRERYAKHLASLTLAARQLLICFEYDQSLLDGPPFSVTETEVASHYDKIYEISGVDHHALPDGMKVVQAAETAWLLEAR